MPEGPSIVILTEEAAKFAGKTVRKVSGNSKQDIQRMRGRKVRAIRSWGKHFLVQFDGFALKVHFMLFGRYRIDEDKVGSDGTTTAPRLSLAFDNGVLNLYACSIKFIEGDKPWSKERLPLVQDRIRDRLCLLSARLGEGEWLDGDFSAGDLMMVSVLLRARPSGLLDEFRNLAAYVARGEARPAYQRAFADQLAVNTR